MRKRTNEGFNDRFVALNLQHGINKFASFFVGQIYFLLQRAARRSQSGGDAWDVGVVHAEVVLCHDIVRLPYGIWEEARLNHMGIKVATQKLGVQIMLFKHRSSEVAPALGFVNWPSLKEQDLVV